MGRGEQQYLGSNIVARFNLKNAWLTLDTTSLPRGYTAQSCFSPSSSYCFCHIAFVRGRKKIAESIIKVRAWEDEIEVLKRGSEKGYHLYCSGIYNCVFSKPLSVDLKR